MGKGHVQWTKAYIAQACQSKADHLQPAPSNQLLPLSDSQKEYPGSDQALLSGKPAQIPLSRSIFDLYLNFAPESSPCCFTYFVWFFNSLNKTRTT